MAGYAARVWKGVKSDLLSLDRKKLGKAKYMVDLVNKLMDAEVLLESVGMVHWLRQEDKIPEYEDFLNQDVRCMAGCPNLAATSD